MSYFCLLCGDSVQGETAGDINLCSKCHSEQVKGIENHEKKKRKKMIKKSEVVDLSSNDDNKNNRNAASSVSSSTSTATASWAHIFPKSFSTSSKKRKSSTSSGKTYPIFGSHLSKTNNTTVKSNSKATQQQKQQFKHGKTKTSTGYNNSGYQKMKHCKRITGTNFIVDEFHPKVLLNSSCDRNNKYFLTHFHYDHYGGLTKKWSLGKIYCSETTAALVMQQLGVSSDYICSLPMNTPVEIDFHSYKHDEEQKTVKQTPSLANFGFLSSSSTSSTLITQQQNNKKEQKLGTTHESNLEKIVTVTLLDANHCPGAVMFLFKFFNKEKKLTKSILHVGDFRWNRDIILHQTGSSSLSPLNPFLKIPTQQQQIIEKTTKEKEQAFSIDELFLDTTYCERKYSKVPVQKEVISETIQVIQRESCQPKEEKTLFLFGSYSIGKERLYLSVAKHLKKKVYVDSNRHRILKAAFSSRGIPLYQSNTNSMVWGNNKNNSGESILRDLITTHRSETNLWVVPIGHLNKEKMNEYLTKYASCTGGALQRNYTRVVGLRPTGWTFQQSSTSLITKTFSCRSILCYGVPYSEHSNFSELVDCLFCLRPLKIIPTVSVFKSKQQCDLLLKALDEKISQKQSSMKQTKLI